MEAVDIPQKVSTPIHSQWGCYPLFATSASTAATPTTPCDPQAPSLNSCGWHAVARRAARLIPTIHRPYYYELLYLLFIHEIRKRIYES